MKKLISLLFALVLTVPMWAWYAYADYGYNSNNSMGLIYVGTSTNPAAGNSSWKNAKTSKSMSGSNKTVYFGAFPKLGYKFVGWYNGSTSSATLVSSANPYSPSLSSATTYYAKFEAITYTSKQTKSYTMKSKSCTMIAYDMGTNDNVYWGDRSIGATDLRGAGLYFRYGGLEAVTSTSSEDVYTQYSSDSHKYTTSGNLPADKDIATITLGEGWRMPTQKEYQTLISKVTTSNFIKDERDDKYAGAKANNNLIFFYYGGYYKSSSVEENGTTYSYMLCRYWTSTLCKSYTSANTYIFKMASTSSYPWTSSIGATNSDNFGTYYALQVKPVYDTRTNYTLTIKGGTNGTSTLKTNTGKWGASFSYTAPVIEGYTFVGWSDGNTDQERTFYTCDMVITAQYEVSASGHTLTWDANGGTLVGGTAAGSVNAGVDIVAPTATRTGYTFAGWSPEVPATMPDADATYQAQWAAVTYNLIYNGLEGASNSNPATYTIETATFALSNPGTRTGYTFTGWTCGGNAITQIAIGSTGDKTITANWTANNYSVTFRESAEDANPNVKSDYHYGDVITNCPAITPQKINFVFTGWYLDGTETRYTSGMTVTGDMIFTARYAAAISVTIPAFDDYGKVIVSTTTNTYTVTSEGNEEDVIYVASGSQVKIEAVPNAYYHFKEWEEDAETDATIYIRTISESVTYTPTWEQNITLSLIDTENEAYYTNLYQDAQYAGKMLTVTMVGRRLTSGNWMTFCAPFEFDIPAGHPMYGSVYRFVNGVMSGTNTEGYISLDFRRTYKIEPNVPYLVVANTTTDTDLEFDGVTIEDDPAKIEVVATSGHVQFVSQPWKGTLLNDALELADFYLASGNTLRYASSTSGTTIRAFRAYFHRLIDLNSTSAPRRIVINLDGVETTKEIGIDGEIEDVTRKYMENGVLYIERNGVIYDAQGQRAE